MIYSIDVVAPFRRDLVGGRGGGLSYRRDGVSRRNLGISHNGLRKCLPRRRTLAYACFVKVGAGRAHTNTSLVLYGFLEPTICWSLSTLACVKDMQKSAELRDKLNQATFEELDHKIRVDCERVKNYYIKLNARQDSWSEA